MPAVPSMSALSNSFTLASSPLLRKQEKREAWKNLPSRFPGFRGFRLYSATLAFA